MPLISPTEQLAMERGELIGEQRGQQTGKQQLIIRQLNRRIGEIESSLIDEVLSLPVEELELLGEDLLDFSTVADLQQWLQNNRE